MTTWANNLNGISSGTTVTTANSGGVSGTAFNAISIPTGGSVTAQTTAAYEGAAGLQIVYPSGSATAGYVDWNISQSIGTRFAASTMFRMAAIPTVQDRMVVLGSMSIEIDTSGRFLVKGGSTVLATSAATTANTWVFVQFAATSNASTTAGRVEAKLYAADGTSLLDYDSGASVNAGTSSPVGIFWGRGSSGVNNGATHSFDLLAADNTLASGFPGTVPVNPYATGQFFPFF